MNARLPMLPPSAASGDEQDFALAFADLIKRLHLELGGEALAAAAVERAAMLAAGAVSAGNASIDLRLAAAVNAGEAPAGGDWLRAVAGSPVVAAPGAQDPFRPLVLDAAGRLYLPPLLGLRGPGRAAAPGPQRRGRGGRSEGDARAASISISRRVTGWTGRRSRRPAPSSGA